MDFKQQQRNLRQSYDSFSDLHDKAYRNQIYDPKSDYFFMKDVYNHHNRMKKRHAEFEKESIKILKEMEGLTDEQEE